MNIFVCDKDPFKAASYLPDKLVVKMITESVQMLCMMVRERGYDSPRLYKDVFKKHPCVKWLRESDDHINWLTCHVFGLEEEYEYRYGKDKRHGSWRLYTQELMDKLPFNYGFNFENLSFTLVMPKEYRSNDPVQSYRLYMQERKSYYATWKAPATKPEWWTVPTKGEK